jgi:hypothetical protein
MAFTSAAGYNNLPNGVFVPEVFSQNVILGFRRISIVPEITNTDYYGEIMSKGDTVRVLLEPEISLFDLDRGTEIPIQDIQDNEITLIVDQGAGYAFRMDDIEKQQAHVAYGDLCANNAAYKLRNNYETNVLTAMYAGVAAANIEGTTGAPKGIGYANGHDYTPLEAIAAIERMLDLQDAPNDGNRFLVADPIFFENLKKEDAKLIGANESGDGKSIVFSPNGFEGRTVSGLRLYKTNNAVVDGSTAVLLGGHRSATASAATILDSEVIRMERHFGDLFRGKMVWGRKVVRPTALAAMLYDYATN